MMWKRVSDNPDRLSPAEFIIFYLQEGHVCGFNQSYALKVFRDFMVKWRYLLYTCRLRKHDMDRLRGMVPRKLRKALADEYKKLSRLYISYRKYRYLGKITVDMRIRYIIHEDRIYPVPPVQEEEDIFYEYTSF